MGSGYHYFDISTLPRLHHVVWCRVPIANNGSAKLGGTVRPALVRGSARDKSSGRSRLWVSYGSAQLALSKRRHTDLIIMNAGRLAELDLPHAVRFNLGLANWLPWASEFFAPPEHSFYIVAGPLSELEKLRLRRCLLRRGIATAL